MLHNFRIRDCGYLGILETEMAPTGQKLSTEEESKDSSLSSLAIDAAALGIEELRERVIVKEPPAQISELREASSEPKTIDIRPDFSALTTSESASLRPGKASIERYSSHAMREAALNERLQRLKERPAFLERVRQSSSRSKTSCTKQYGLFKNPFFKYRGGVVSRIISFFANLLKLLEILMLRGLSKLKSSPKKVVSKTEPAIDPILQEAKRKAEEERAKERKKMSLPGARQSSR